jgi:hypothetical protein
MLAGGLALSVGFMPAAAVYAADDLAPAEATTNAELDPDNDIRGLRVNLEGGSRPISTSLFALVAADGALLHTYCVELHVAIDHDYPEMEEVPWDDYPDPDSPFHQNRDYVNWILHESYPAASLEEIEETVDHDFDDGLSVDEAIAAEVLSAVRTQLAQP